MLAEILPPGHAIGLSGHATAAPGAQRRQRVHGAGRGAANARRLPAGRGLRSGASRSGRRCRLPYARRPRIGSRALRGRSVDGAGRPRPRARAAAAGLGARGGRTTGMRSGAPRRRGGRRPAGSASPTSQRRLPDQLAPLRPCPRRARGRGDVSGQPSWVVTDLRNSDGAARQELYQGYGALYRAAMPDAKLQLVWRWLHAPDHELSGIVVRTAAHAAPLGLAHYRPFPAHCTAPQAATSTTCLLPQQLEPPEPSTRSSPNYAAAPQPTSGTWCAGSPGTATP